MLYQLSYSRESQTVGRADGQAVNTPHYANLLTVRPAARPTASGGEGDRTPDLVNAIHALSQLSYAPIILFRSPGAPLRREHGNLAGALGGVKRSAPGV